MYLDKAIFFNRAPFENLTLCFKKTGINVLSAINGKGKTTILSYITDAFYELARKNFSQEFKGNENTYYRISSPLDKIDEQKISLVYLRFQHDNAFYDYIDVRGACISEEYDGIVHFENKIPFAELKKQIGKENNIKFWNKITPDTIEQIFSQNLLTFFPAYRYENPAYLTNLYAPKTHYKTGLSFTGYLKNPIQSIFSLQEVVQWFMDVVLDNHLYKDKTKKHEKIIISINEIISKILSPKLKEPVRIGIGERHISGKRVSIVKRDLEGTVVYPSIFNTSSGESALIALFGEILRQTDNLGLTIDSIEGIVLIDEIDKHLHITLQKEILPLLLNYFPKIQFITSSHSPFFNMGLAEHSPDKNQIFDLNNNGIISSATTNELYKEFYNLVTTEHQKFYDAYHKLENEIKNSKKPLIITEGKTDYKHLKAALSHLNKNLEIEFYEGDSSTRGDEELSKILEHFGMIKQPRKIIGIFDRDNEKIINKYAKTDSEFMQIGIPQSNVFAFCIPLLNDNDSQTKISIEHYYNEKNLLKFSPDGKRLFIGKEFYECGNSTNGKYQTKTKALKHKVEINGIIDEKVYEREDLEQKKSIALSKNDFAELVLNTGYSQNFDFANFEKIFEIIQKIIEIG